MALYNFVVMLYQLNSVITLVLRCTGPSRYVINSYIILFKQAILIPSSRYTDFAIIVWQLLADGLADGLAALGRASGIVPSHPPRVATTRSGTILGDPYAGETAVSPCS